MPLILFVDSALRGEKSRLRQQTHDNFIDSIFFVWTSSAYVLGVYFALLI